ncbi:hypothetical protein [Streptomyces boninensis]|uniref:hypothetical protein n=1 Tax=Streptomyces boninensis TaxID=2039455 RepID=UPI003B20BCD8
MRKTRQFTVVAAAFATVAGIGIGVAPSANAAQKGNGHCATSEICVYQQWGRHKSKGYYDLGEPEGNFHGQEFINTGDNLSDRISSWKAGRGTSCKYFAFYVNVGFRGEPLKISRGTEGNLSGPALAYWDDVASSYRKREC